MKKLLKQAVSQIIVLAITAQMLGQYGYPIIPQIISSAEETETSYSDENDDANLLTESTDMLSEDNISEESVQYEESVTNSENTYDDLTIDSDFTLNESKKVNNLTISNGTLNLNGYDITVYGNVILTQDGKLNCSRGEIVCNNFTMNSRSYLYMTNANDHIVVNGNFVHNGGYFYSTNATAGTIEIKGNFTSKTSNFNPNTEHKIIFNGTEKQTISLNGSSSTFNILEINNTSKEGVFSETPVPANSYIIGESKVNFGGCDAIGETLTADKTIEGDYCLATGKLDLAGHKLTINGNLIQTGGEVCLNGGTLEVTGDYRIQSRTENEDGTYKYGYSTGFLTMTNENDRVIVNGDFVTDSSVNHEEKLTAGIMTIGGNFTQLNSNNGRYNFAANENHKVVLSGNTVQNISFAEPSYSKLANIEINNKNFVVFKSDIYLVGTVYDNTGTVSGSKNLYISNLSQLNEYNFSGGVYLNNSNQNLKLEHDLTVGRIIFNYLHLNGNKLSADNITVNSGLYVEGGTVECRNNLYFERYSYFSMMNDKDYVLVGGNLTTDSYYGSAEKLTDGVLVIKGDFIQTYNSNFICEGNHVTILSGKKAPSGREYIQTVQFKNPGTSKFNILKITKPQSQYKVLNSSGKEVSFDLIYNELEEKYSDSEPPSKVENVTASSVGATSVHILWSPSSDDTRVMGYDIYRNNKKIQTTGKTEFTDNHLMPETEYVYEIYAFDECKNYSEASDQLTIVTEKDTENPSVPQNLKVRSRTGSSITLMWNLSADNVETVGYKIFRNDEEIAEVIGETVYKDTKLVADKEYTYKIKAYDAAGNCSDFSDSVSSYPVKPSIKEILPKNNSKIGGKTQRITVTFPDTGNSMGNKVKFEYKESGSDEYIPISAQLIGQKKYSYKTLSAECDWDLTGLNGSYNVRATLYDADENSCSKEVEYTVDSSGSAAPTDFKAESNNGLIILTWTPSVSANCDKYIIYRSDKEAGEYTELAVISKKETVRYVDKTVKIGGTYFYKIEAVSSYGIAGSPSDAVSAKVAEDKEIPNVSEILPLKSRVNKTAEITVNATDNISVEKIKLEYKSDDSDKWSLIGEENASNGRAVFKWNTTVLDDGEYTVRAFAFDGSGNCSEEFIKKYTADNTGIGKIKIIADECTASSSFVSIRWEDVTENDFGWFAVEKKDDSGKFIEVGKSSQITGMHIENLQPDTDYVFRVVGYDDLGNRGEESDEITLTTTSDSINPAIRSFYPASSAFNSEINISINAADNIGIKNMKLRYSYDSADEKKWTELASVDASGISTDKTLSYKFDISELPEGEIYVEAVVSDTSGNQSEPCINKYKIDRTAPNAINDLNADGSGGSVHLTWTVSDDDIKSFEIYRCEDEKGVYSRITTCSTKDYYDISAKFGCTYTYKVIAVDIAGNRSADSNEAITQVADDITVPSVLGFRYSSGTVLPANPSFSVVASDNYKLSKAEIEYRKSDSEDGIWYELCTLDMNSSYQSADFRWDTENLIKGKYILKAVVYDAAGNISESFTAEYILDLTAPSTPDIEAIQGNWELTVNWSENTEDDFDFYRLYRKSDSDSKYICLGDTRENSYTDTDVSPEKMYSYKIEAYDKCGNHSENTSNSVRPDNTDTVPPQANVSEQLFGITDSEVAFDGSESTDNVRISKFVWDFGDGSKGYGVRTVHTYKKAGTYEANLTVYDDAGFSDSSTFTVTVYDRTKYGNMQIEVTDDGGRPLKYAYVYLYSSEKDSEISIRADSNGIANISALTGKHQIAAYKDGYLPVKKEVEINSVGNNNKIRIALQSGELVTGNLSVHRMSLEEMVEAGIDFNNPANYHTYSFTIELTFAQEPIPTVIQYIQTGGTGGYGGSGGFGGGGFIGGGCSSPSNSVKLKDGSTVKIQPIVYDSPEIEEEIPILAYVRTTQNISFMKDMYAVDLGVINNASSEFVIKNCSATLNLPDGLSLAATTKKQSLVQDMGDIAGQEKKTISWAVKGDKKGEYNLSADFSGTLMPFNAPVRANFQTDEPFRVGAGDGIVITVMPESAAYIGENYYIQFSVSNTGSDTFYNLKTSFGELVIPGKKIDITVTDPEGNVKKYQDSQPDIHIDNANKCKSNLVIYGNQVFEIGTFESGDVIYGTLVSGFSAPGDPEEVYYKLIDYIVEEHNKDTNVKVVVSPIASHITKYNVKQQYVTDTWGDPVDMTTGGFIDSLTAMSVTGDSSLDFNLDYNSMNSAASGELGYGWSHNFETYLEKSQGGINVHWSPSNYSFFIDEDSKNGNIKGTVENDCIRLTESEDTGAKGYLPVSTGFDGYRLYRDEHGIYTLTAPGGAENVFDQDGRLIKIVNANGKKINIERNGNTAVISEEITGVNLILTYNDSNQVTSVEDGNGRKSTISYENGCISSVTNASGNTVSYEYDENNRLISATVEGDELPYVVNKYDENGRVIEQDDGDENTSLTYFYYDENEKNGTLTVTATDRNNIYDAENKKNSHQVQYVSDWLGHVISFTDQNGGKTVYTYDSKGNLTSATDASGNKTVYTYDKNGWVTSIKDSAGNMSQMTYDSNGNITSVTGPNGEKSSYTYNENNLLVKSVENSGVVKEYEYNENAQLINETVEGIGSKSYNYTDGRITSVTDFMGNVSETAYDVYGNVASMTDRDGNKTSYVYDELNRLISLTTTDGTVSYNYDSRGNKISATDTRDNTVNYSYNGNNFMTQLETVKGITKYDYDNEGRLIAQTAPDGTVFRNEYDPVGNIIKSVNENGEICEYTYDATGNVKTKTLVNGTDRYTEKYEYYAGGKLKKVTFADGTSESYEYDSSWRLTKVTDELENSLVTTYDSSGNVLSVTDAEGNKTQYTYDKYGRMLTATDANGNVTTFDKYDANGNCLQETLPSGQIICMTYSNEGLLLTVTMKCNDDISISYEYDASGRVTKYIDEEGNEFITEYDSAGNVVKLLDAKGNMIQENTYDELSYLVSSTDALGIETQYNYDSVGNLIKTIESINTAREAETSYEYDKIGRIIQSVDAENGKSAYEYDAVGNIIAQIDPNGGRSEYSYDSMGRITESISPLGSKKQYTYNAVGLLEEAENAKGQKTEYTYYKNGWIKSFTDELGTVSYTYDGNGNVLTVTDENGTITREYNSMNQVTKYTDFRGNTIKYSYDQIGNLVALTYPGGRIVRYSYYKNGNIKTVTDWDGKVISYEYDGNSRLTKTVRPDGSVETRTYDAAGRMTSKVDVNGDIIISHMNYSYDESGNITNIDTTNAMGVAGLSSAEMVYNENNQLVKYNGKTVKYDADGNMIYGPLNGEMADFKYDCRNRLVSAGGTTYAYDAENIRISKTVDKVKTEYVIDSTGSLTRVLTASTDGKTTYFVYGIGLISQEDESEVLFYHFNNIGSTEAVTSLDGKIQEKFEYGPYGELLSENKCGIIFLYNGEYGVSTDENGLYYMRARYYNPEIKRFINQDVLTGSIIDSPTLNRYAYVEGNPISLADPFGLSPAINWGHAGHTILGFLGLLTFVPGLNFVGIAANAVNAAWYFSEGDIFNGICSGLATLPGIGGAVGKIGSASKFSNAALMIQKGTQIASSVGFMGTGFYTIGKIGYENYQKYVERGEDFSALDALGDTVNGAFAVLSIYGGAKGLGFDKVNVPTKLKGSVFIGKSNGSICNTHTNPINAYEVTTYKDFASRSVVGDNLEGHEMWQHANINANGLAAARLSSDVSKNNPVIALPKNIHVIVNKEQKAFNARTQTPVENILANAKILYKNDQIPDDKVDYMLIEAMRHFRATMGK